LTDFDLLVGSNNSGKSILLQALAIWNYCVDQFNRTKRGGTRGIQIVLPDFTALPLPEFVLLWKDKIERKNVKQTNGKNKPDFILIEINVFWLNQNNQERNLNIQLRYQSPLSIYAIPEIGLEDFKILIQEEGFPTIIYVPPFSGLEPVEKWIDDGNIKQSVGKGQPGSVLRNILYRVKENENITNWKELSEKIFDWFGVKLNIPEYEKRQSTQINLTYKVGKKDFDIISGGSGFHQILTILAFIHGYSKITTVLFDEPDAHLHSNLQRQILNYFKTKVNIQFLIATHSEEFIKGVEIPSIISILSGSPIRTQSTESIIRAMSDVNNSEVVKTKESPFIFYLEGEDDERILSSWAETLGFSDLLSKFYIYKLGGTTKQDMNDKSDRHFKALRIINPEVKRIVLFDYDTEESFHPKVSNPVVKEWKRKNIENYLLVPDAWKNAILDALNIQKFDLFSDGYRSLIDSFFEEQNLNLPKNKTWNDVNANIFQVLDGKRILFENNDSLFHKIMGIKGVKINREKVARSLSKKDIHQDIIEFFNDLQSLTNEV
jgi:AAA15 family ATPase/GTPase